MLDIAPIVVPEFLYNALLCGLITAACWHAVCLGDSLLKRMRGSRGR